MNCKKNTNRVHMEFCSASENERFARMAVAAFVSVLDPTLEELADLKTAVSEAVTNAIIHGYENGEGIIYLTCMREGRKVIVEIEDKGIGMEDIEKAREPLYTTRPEWERSGMGFCFMENFMDELEVQSEPGQGTRIIMKKNLSFH